MSDLSIPGVPGASKYNTDKIIEDLMAVERIPLDRLEERRTRYETQRSAWQDLNRNLSRLRDTSKSLFGFDNPFNDRVASSSDDEVVTATAERTAIEEVSRIIVKRTASRDRFATPSLSRDYEVPEGIYRFAVGEKETGFSFRGGSLRTFARTINERAGDILRARVVRDTADTEVFLLEGLETGAANTLRFLEDSAAFGVGSGMLKPADDTFRDLTVDRATVRSLTNPIDDEYVRFLDTGALVEPLAALRVPLAPSVEVKEGLVMEITYSMTKIPYEYTPPTPPPGPSTPEAPGIEFQGIVIRNESSRVVAPDWQPPKPPERRDDLTVFSVVTDGGEIELPAVADTEGSQTISVPLGDYGRFVSGLNLRNDNTHRTFTLEHVKIFDPTSRGEFLPTNAIEAAGDAVVLIDGIEVLRSSNEIDDLIPGVTLTLHSASDEPVEISIAPDRDAVKEAIIAFVGQYNQLLSEINILTTSSENVIDEIGYLSDDERANARERLGLFQGDITLMQLKSRAQTIMMNSYPTRDGRRLALLDQIGVSTNPARTGAGAVDRARLRGYLDIDEAKLDAALAGSMDAVRELFGQDTDGDMIVDSGVAFAFDRYAKPYVETGGFIATRLSTLSNQISTATEDIEDFEARLARIEQEYRKEYGAMEGALNALERSSQQLDNFNRSGGNGR